MILFWAICALCLIIALAFILPTLLDQKSDSSRQTDRERRNANIAVYRDQLNELAADLKNGIISEPQYEQDREEIERRLLEDTAESDEKSKPLTATTDRRTAYVLGLGIPLIAVIFYYNLGQPGVMSGETGPAAAARPAAPASGQRSQQQIEANVAALAKRLQTNPNDAEGWVTLARSYSSMERFGEAAGAYAKATELNPKNAELLAEYAFVSAKATNDQLQGRPTELIEQALKLDPNNWKALQLAGRAAFQIGDYGKAIEYWEKLLKSAPGQDPELRSVIQAQIEDARSKLAPGPRR
jgi:cytochrome c-type biogenesis protein CcmH